jgi:glutaredoxin
MVTPASLKDQPAGKPSTVKRQVLSALGVVLLVWGLSQGWQMWQSKSLAQTIKHQAQGQDIVMYTTASCPYCARARQWLASHQIAFRECNVDEDQQCAATYASQGSPGVPLMHVRGRWQLGFEPQWLAQALERTPGAGL